jgi:hypothetical protein
MESAHVHLLDVSECEKDLGVYVDSCLTFHCHVEHLVKKGMQLVGWIRKAFSSRSARTLMPVYECVVRPALEYASTVWNPTQIGQIRRLESVQRRFSKMVYGMNELSYDERIIMLGLDKLSTRRLYFDIMMTRNIILAGSVLCNKLFTLDRGAVASGCRAHNYKLFKHSVKLALRYRFFSNRIVDGWNRIPPTLVEHMSCSTFSCRLRNALSNNSLL